jgi:hypothetical protein
MLTRSRSTGQRFALAVILLLTFAVPLLVPSAVAQTGSSGPTTIRRDVHHDTSLPLSR